MSHSTNIPFVYERDGKFLVQVPFSGRKITVGRFVSKVNAFIALNVSLGLLYSPCPMRRLSLALKRRRSMSMMDKLRIVVSSDPENSPENVHVKKDMKEILDGE